MSARNDNLDLSRTNPISNEKATSSDFAGISKGDGATGHSTAREDYALHYRVLRMHGVHLDDIYAAHYNPQLISSKALLSIEAKDAELTGWINRDRLYKFIIGNSGNRYSVWGIPF